MEPALLGNQMKCDERGPGNLQSRDVRVTIPGRARTAIFQLRVETYLAIANEFPAPGEATAHTTVYRIERVKN